MRCLFFKHILRFELQHEGLDIKSISSFYWFTFVFLNPSNIYQFDFSSQLLSFPNLFDSSRFTHIDTALTSSSLRIIILVSDLPSFFFGAFVLIEFISFFNAIFGFQGFSEFHFQWFLLNTLSFIDIIIQDFSFFSTYFSWSALLTLIDSFSKLFLYNQIFMWVRQA